MRMFYHVMSAPGPLGLLFLARSERGMRHLEFMDQRSLKRTIAGHKNASSDETWQPSLLELKPMVEQLEGYFSGAVRRFDVPLDPVGTEFQIAVWRALLEIPYGATRSYGDIAKRVGQPGSARAVGLANNQNPLAIIVPCHRVIGSDGKLVGYGGGMPRKKFLLGLETRFSALEVLEYGAMSPEIMVKHSREDIELLPLPTPKAAYSAQAPVAGERPASAPKKKSAGAAKPVAGKVSKPRAVVAKSSARPVAKKSVERRTARAARRPARATPARRTAPKRAAATTRTAARRALR